MDNRQQIFYSRHDCMRRCRFRKLFPVMGPPAFFKTKWNYTIYTIGKTDRANIEISFGSDQAAVMERLHRMLLIEKRPFCKIVSTELKTADLQADPSNNSRWFATGRVRTVFWRLNDGMFMSETIDETNKSPNET